MLWICPWSYQSCSSSNLIRFDASYISYQIWNTSNADYKISILDLVSYKKLIRYEHEHIMTKFLVKSVLA